MCFVKISINSILNQFYFGLDIQNPMKLDQIDLEFLYLGMTRNGTFNEQDLIGSDLAYLGVGRTLDKIAHLKENNLLSLAGERFAITDAAKNIFWAKDTPLQTRILRLLEIKPFEEASIAKYLLEPYNTILSETEKLRSQGLIIHVTINKDDRIIRVCEITQDGVECTSQGSQKLQMQKLLDEIQAKSSSLDNTKITETIEKLRKISTELG